MKPLNSCYLLLFSSLLASCGLQQQQATSALDVPEAVLGQPLTANEIEQLRSVSVLQYYHLLLAETSDDEVAFDHSVVGQARAVIGRAAPMFAVLQARYGSIGAMLAANSGQSLTCQDVARDMANMASAYMKKGEVFSAAFVGGEPSATGVASDDGRSGQAMRNFAALETIGGLLTPASHATALVSYTPLPISTEPSNKKRNCSSGGTMYLVHHKFPSNFGAGHSATYFQGNAAAGIQSFYQNYPRVGVQFDPPPLDEAVLNSGKNSHPNDIEVVEIGDVSTDQAQAMLSKLQNPSDEYSQQTIDGTGYNLVMNNCAQRAMSVIKDAGFDVQGGVLLPEQLYNTVKGYVNDQTSSGQ